MKSVLLPLVVLTLLASSCQKEPDDILTEPPPPIPTGREFPKIKTLTVKFNIGAHAFELVSHYRYDSLNNKIRVVEYINGSSADSSVVTFSYNNKNQLIEYEHKPETTVFPPIRDVVVRRMQFIRNANGQLEKTLSNYDLGRVTQSEGKFSYTKNGDTTFITYLDSIPKHQDKSYYDAADYYRVGVKSQQIVSFDYYPIYFYGPWGSRQELVYDNSGNMIQLTQKDLSGGQPQTYTFKRSSRRATELQKSIARIYGDLTWFFRSKEVSFGWLVGDSYHVTGNTLDEISGNYSGFGLIYDNTFNAQGELINVKTYRQVGGPVELEETIEYFP